MFEPRVCKVYGERMTANSVPRVCNLTQKPLEQLKKRFETTFVFVWVGVLQ